MLNFLGLIIESLGSKNIISKGAGMSMSNRELIREFALDEHIVCPLCQDYFSDAVTLNSCLHSFCRKCLQKCLNFSPTNSSSAVYKCPKCFVDLGAEPAYRRDPKLQEMTYKLVPDLLWRQIRKAARRRHRHHSSGDSTQLSERRIEQRKQMIQISTQLCSANEKISIQIDFVPLSAVLAPNEEKGEEAQNKEMPLPQEASAKHSFRRFLRCSSKVRIEQLKKLLELKLAMTESYGVYFIDPTLRDILEDEYSLEDLIEMFQWSRDAPFQLRFTLARIPVKEEEDHPPILEEMPQLDVESGPMERPIHQDQSPRVETEKIDNVPLRNKKDDKKESTLAAADGSKKDEVPSTSGSSSHSHTRHKVPSSSPPANFSSMPRLSTAGVSPLRPVPSYGNFGGAVPSTNHHQQQTTTASKKRKRNSAIAAGEKAKMVQQGPSSAQKMLKFGPDLKTKDAENNAKTMISPLASSLQNETGPKSDEMNKESVKKEENAEPQSKGPEIPSTVANQPPSIQSSSLGQEPPSSIQTTSSLVQKTPKEKKKRQPANPKPKQNSANKKTQPKMPSSIPSFTLGGIGPQSSSSAQQPNQSMGSATTSGPSTTTSILLSPQQFGKKPIIQMQNQQQQQYAAAQFMQNLLQQNRQANDAFGALAGMFQGLSPQQVQAMQQMIGGMANLAAMANGVVQQQSQGQQQKMAYNKVPAAKQQSNGIGTSKLGSNLNGTKSSSHKAKTSPQKMTSLPTMAPTSSIKSNNQQLFASSSQHAQSAMTHLKSNQQSAQKIIVSSSSINPNILNPNPLLTTATMKATTTMPS